MHLLFEQQVVKARLRAPSGDLLERRIEVRTNPISGRTSRIAYSRSLEQERGAARLPDPPPDAADRESCPFCRANIAAMTPMLDHGLSGCERHLEETSLLFPNLYPYGAYSAVSLFDDQHFVEIGTADYRTYAASLRNCRQYLLEVLGRDPQAFYMAVTQNHLPAAGGSLVHPHLQLHADRIASNHHRFLAERAAAYHSQAGGHLLTDYLTLERRDAQRYIGRTGAWHWLAAFAPEGFYEIWGILPGRMSFCSLGDAHIADLARGIINTQRFYRSLGRNGYNMGILLLETAENRLELRCVLIVRANYAPWVRNDHTGYELMLGDMATFTAPEDTAQAARPFWSAP